MSHAITETILASAIATSGTFTVPFPAGIRRGDLVPFQPAVIFALGTYYNSPRDFTLTADATNITVTWRATATLPAGTTVKLQVGLPGPDPAIAATAIVPQTGARVQPLNTSAVEVVFLDLGSPIAANASFFRAAAGLTGTAPIAVTLLANALDVPRNVTITSAGNDTGITFTVTGLDAYGQTVVETITGANAGVAAGVKAFARVNSITASGNAAGNVNIGFGDVLGLPVHLPGANFVLAQSVDAAAPTAGTIVAGQSPQALPTATTADVRGTYAPHASAAPNGSRAIGLLVALPDPTFLGNPQFAG